MYYTDDIVQFISTDEMLEKYIDVEEFIQYCKACPNFGQKWSCPEYDFDPIEIWKQHNTLFVVGRKIIYSKNARRKTYSKEEIAEIMNDSLKKERASLDLIMSRLEERTPNSLTLYAGSCTLCEKCTKPEGEPCRYPDKMRYSIESLGGNVALLTEELLGVPLKWGKDGKLPPYFTLVCGLLY